MRDTTMSGVVRDSPCPQTRPSHMTIINFRSSEYCVSDNEDIVPSNPTSPSEYAVTMRIVYNCVAIAVTEAQSSNFAAFFFRIPFPCFVGVLLVELLGLYSHRSKNGSTSLISTISTPFRGDRFAGFGFVGVGLLSRYGDHRFPPTATFGVLESFQLMNQLNTQAMTNLTKTNAKITTNVT